MKNIALFSIILSSLLSLSSCDDWLLAPAPGTSELKDYFTNGNTAIQATNAVYTPLMWEYDKTYYNEWFIGDVVSDDALKGGQSIGDMSTVYDMENFKTATNNALLLDFYRAQYQGIGRANLVIQEIPLMKTDSTMSVKVKERLLGEAHFLRAFYYFRLVRIFGGVPKIDFVVESAKQWKQPRASREDIYAFISQDLEIAAKNLWKKKEYKPEDLGRATKGAAQAMLLKVYLYTKQYDKAKIWSDSIIKSKEYSLVEYAQNFTLEGENGTESVFEIQYMSEPTSDFGEGNGFTRGTFTTILTRSRASKAGGWGFNKPTQNLYDEFEPNDPRRDITILNPTNDEIENPEQEIYLGCRYLNKKYALINENGTYLGLTHMSRSPINNKVIRYSDVLLMYAEACCETNDLSNAKWALEEVRKRARGTDITILPTFPYGNYIDNQNDLRKAIRHERRVELAMEGHRWFDLVRWGIAKEVMDKYAESETETARKQMAPFVAGKHELFPIPAAEIDMNPMSQNNGY